MRLGFGLILILASNSMVLTCALVPLPKWAVPIIGCAGVVMLMGALAFLAREETRINTFVIESFAGGGYYTQESHDSHDPTASAQRIARARRGLAGCARRLGSALLLLCACPMQARVAPTPTPQPPPSESAGDPSESV